METLTAQQAKQVIEYFAQQAAEDAPHGVPYTEWEKHVWRTRMAVSVAIDRRVQDNDWTALLAAELDWQTFDRDSAGFMWEHGLDGSVDDMLESLEDRVSLAIDNCWANSGA